MLNIAESRSEESGAEAEGEGAAIAIDGAACGTAGNSVKPIGEGEAHEGADEAENTGEAAQGVDGIGDAGESVEDTVSPLDEAGAEPGAMRPIATPLTATPPATASPAAGQLGGNTPADLGLASEAEVDAGSLLALQSLERHRQKKRKKRIIQIVVLAVIAAIVVIGLVFFFLGQNQGGEEEEQIITDYVTRGDFESVVTASGSTQPVNSVAVTPEIDGIIDQVNVAEGQTVNQGDLLFTIKNDELDSKVREAELGVESAWVSYNSADAAVDAAYAAYNAAAAQGFPEEGESEASLRAAIDASEIDLQTAGIAVNSAQDAYDEAVATAAKRSVYAPISGSIVVMNAISGEAVGSATGQGGSSSGSLMQIADLTQMTVTVQVNEVDINQISVGQKARITFSAIEGLELQGEVMSIASVASGGGSDDDYYGSSSGVVTYGVKILIPQPDPQLKPGMTASVAIVTQYVPDTLLAPASAVMSNGDGTGILTVVTDEATMATEERTVKIIAQDSSLAAIEGDVEEGDLIVISMSFGGDDMYDDEGDVGYAVMMG